MFEPSYLITRILDTVADRPAAADGMQAIMQRAAEFPSPVQAQLAGIALDPAGRAVAEQALDRYWADQDRQDAQLRGAGDQREVIIGSGFHAATYAAIRVLAGFGRPLVLERGPRVGGTFAMTEQPTFYLNSRNRRGPAGLAGDQGTSLNYLPGAPIQAANVSMAEYQTNADMAFVIRATLAQFADVVPSAQVDAIFGGDDGLEIDIHGRGSIPAGRVIDARGLGDPAGQDVADGTSVLTFGQFMARMAGVWPLRGLRRVAVVGGGDSAKCAIESLLGLAPEPRMAAAALDYVERVDCYSQSLPDTCDQWQEQERARYQAIGRYLREDQFGVRRLTVIDRQARPVALPTGALIDGRTYDLAVVCTGNRETPIVGLDAGSLTTYFAPDGVPVARKHDDRGAYRVGPHARLRFTDVEIAGGIAAIPANAVAMFRTGPKTAALAASLPPITGN
jgi:hypothetical protein